MMNLIGTIVLTAIVAFNLNATISAMSLSSTGRLATSAAAGLWIGLALALAAAGTYAPAAAAVPIVGVMAGLPVIVVGTVALFSAGARRALLSLPISLLIGVNALRVAGVFFVLLSMQGRLSGPFPQFAGWGDIIVGLGAIPLARSVAAEPDRHHSALFRWNLLGLLDLVTAVSLGITSAPGAPFQIFGGTVGSTAIWTLPWSVIPTVLVPFFLIVHVIIFAKLARSGASAGGERSLGGVATQ